jgi:ligand-binding sensor domain-containing protein
MRRHMAFLALILLSSAVTAQTYEWLNYSPGQRCNSVALDGEMVWIGTTGGLACYHRSTQTMEFINHANSDLPSNRISCVAVDPAGVKWICISHGPLVRYDGNSMQSFTPGFWYVNFNSIAIAGVNDIWLGTELGGLVHFDGANFIQYTGYTSNPDTPNAYDVQLDSLGRVWFSNHDGTSLTGELVCWDGANWSYLSHPQPPPSYSCATAFAIGANGDFWIGTNQFGVFHYDGENWTQYTEDNSQLQGRYVLSLAEKDGWVWIGTEDGLNVFTGSAWAIYNTSTTPSMLSNHVWDIVFDDTDSSWFATSQGLMRKLGTLWICINTSNTILSANRVNTQLQTMDGTQWFGTYDGLISFDGQNWNLIDLPADDLEVVDLATDSTGNIWLATRYSGILKYDGTAFTVYNTANSALPSNNCKALAIDSQNRIWVATVAHGLGRLEGDTWTVWNTLSSLLPTNYLTMVEVDPMDNVWVNAARNNYEPWALIRISGEIWTPYVYDPEVPGLTTFWVNDMQYRHCCWWFATGDGLAKLENEVWTVYNEDYCQLPSFNFQNLAFDAQGRLWLATLSHGIACFHEGAFNTWQNEDSGLASDQCNYIYLDSQGRKWMGHQYDGVSVFSGGDVGVEAEELPKPEFALQVWPNPFSDRVWLNLNQPRSRATVSLFNLKGQLLHRWELPAGMKPALELEAEVLGGLASGIYIWQVETDQGIQRAKGLKIR